MIATAIKRPAGGFFLWLDVSKQGGSEIVTKRLWAEAGVRVVPGRYLAREQADGSNPGADYIRVAMVQDKRPRRRRCIASSPCSVKG